MKITDLFEGLPKAITSVTPTKPIQPIQPVTANKPTTKPDVHSDDPEVLGLEGKVLSATDAASRKQALVALRSKAPNSLVSRYFTKHMQESKFIATFIKKDNSYVDHAIQAKDKKEAMQKASEIIKSLKDTVQLKDLEMSHFNEARVPGLDYKNEYKGKKEPVFDRVILTLTAKDSEIMTKLAFKYKKLDNLQKMITEQRNKMNEIVKQKMDELFDAEDVLVTREIDTVSATMVLARKTPDSPAIPARVETVTEWDQVALGIMALLDDELLPKAQQLLADFTKINRIAEIPARPGKSPALTVTPKESRIYESTVIDKIKAYGKKILQSFLSWGKKYDFKLDTINARIAQVRNGNKSVSETMYYVEKPGGEVLSYTRKEKAEQQARLFRTKVLTDISDEQKEKLKFKESLSEGCWALPKTRNDAIKILTALRKPLNVTDFKKQLGTIIGDDNLYDMIEDIADENANADIRDVVKNYIIKTAKDSDQIVDAKAAKVIKALAKQFTEVVTEVPQEPKGYAERVAELEAEGMTTSDAQAVADAEFAKNKPIKEDATKIPEITGTPTFWTNVVEEASKGKLFDQKFESGYYTGIVKTKYAKQVDKIAKRLGDILNQDIKLMSTSKSYSASKDKIAIDNALYYLGYDDLDEVDTTDFVVIEVELKTKSTFPGLVESDKDEIPFDKVKAELRKIGISLKHDYKEYRVNFLNGTEDTAYYTDDLYDAIATGKHMAKTADNA